MGKLTIGITSIQANLDPMMNAHTLMLLVTGSKTRGVHNNCWTRLDEGPSP